MLQDRREHAHGGHRRAEEARVRFAAEGGPASLGAASIFNPGHNSLPSFPLDVDFLRWPEPFSPAGCGYIASHWTRLGSVVVFAGVRARACIQAAAAPESRTHTFWAPAACGVHPQANPATRPRRLEMNQPPRKARSQERPASLLLSHAQVTTEDPAQNSPISP